MDAKSLMIGDLVRHANGEIKRVSCIKQNCFACDRPHLWSYNNEFSPIPLTEEIMEANGFVREYSEYNEYLWFPKQGTTYITQYKGKSSDFCVESTDIELHYVHELQHALRLCGLNELADNFVITKGDNYEDNKS